MRTEAYNLIINTEDYSGNFEREMHWYITGCTEEYRESYIKNLKEGHHASGPSEALRRWYELNMIEEDGEYGHCYVHIHPTEGWYNDGLGREYRISDNINYKGNKYDSYLSVKIGLRSEPSEEIWKEIVDRAKKFCENKKITLTSLEIIKKNIIKTETEDVIRREEV